MFERLQIRENSVVIYEEKVFSSKYPNRDKQRQNAADARKTQYSGKMTAGARKRMGKAITLMVQGTKARWLFCPETGKYHYHRLSLITLTIASDRKLVDNQYEELLKPFLRWLREVKGVEAQTWKLEFQERGQIHYHITSPAFIYHEEIRAKWNAIQRENGLLREWVKEHGHYNPPSTEIAEVKNVKKMSNYLLKEMGKSVDAKHVKAGRMVDSLIKAGEIPAEKKKKFVSEYTGVELKTQGRVWGCSDNLAAGEYYTVDLVPRILDMLKEYERKGQVFWLSGDYFSIVYFNEDLPPPWHLLTDFQKRQFDDHVANIFQPKQVAPCCVVPILPEAVPLANPEISYEPEQLYLCFN